MRKVFIVSAILFSYVFSQASQAPKVNCELTYVKSNPDGTTAVQIPGPRIPVTEAPAQSENNGFVLDADLKPICPAGLGGKCSGDFTLMATVSRGHSNSGIIVRIRNTDKFERYATWLTIGDELGHLKCDLNL